MAELCNPEELPGSADKVAGVPDEMFCQFDETAVKTVDTDEW